MATTHAQNGPKVSIGLPVYNGDRYLSETLDSILGQTFDDFDLIISDNASTDATEKICREYSRTDSRIQYVRQHENIGAYPNFNATLAEATGEYFRWAGADDLLRPTCLEQCVAALDAIPEAVLAAPQTQLIDENGKVIPKTEDRPQEWVRQLNLRSPLPSERLEEFLQKYVWIGCASQLFGLMRRSVLLETPGLKGYPSSDYLFLAEMALRGHLAEVSEPLYRKRMHDRNSGGVAIDKDGEKMAEYVNADRKVGPQWMQFRWVSEFLDVLQRVPLSAQQRRASYWVFLREFVYPHKRMIAEEGLAMLTDSLTFGRRRPSQKLLGFMTSYKY